MGWLWSAHDKNKTYQTDQRETLSFISYTASSQDSYLYPVLLCNL